MSIELDKFTYDDLRKYPVICNLGKRRSGKTNLTRDQCYGKRLCVIDPKNHTMSDAVAYMTGAAVPEDALEPA